MTAFGKVKSAGEGKAVVEVARSGACCGDCAGCSGCGSDSIEVTAVCEIEVESGSAVKLFTPAKYVYAAMALLFLSPVILPLLGYFLTLQLGKTAACAAAVLLLLVSFAVIFALSKNKRFMRKLTPRVVETVNKK